MIRSAAEFVQLRTSSDPAEYHRAAHDEAPDSVWRELIDGFPEMREWVAHNKTVPLWALTELAKDPDERVRFTVAMKRKLPTETLRVLATDSSDAVAQAAQRRLLDRTD